MIIGIDFDNTIIEYDHIFHTVALERELIPESLPVSKLEVRDYLRAAGREDDWTEMQGYVYGLRMAEAEPYPGAIDFIRMAVDGGHTLLIISHKTRYPYLGHQYDLHQAAQDWLDAQGLFNRFGLPRGNVFFELTKQDKLRRIGTTRCSYFVDDLPEFLAEGTFPMALTRVLFDPNDKHPGSAFRRVTGWDQAAALILNAEYPIPDEEALGPVVDRLLAEVSIEGAGPPHPISGGGNNRVYHLPTPGRDLLVKQYWRHPADPRDRLGNEVRFSAFAWENGLRQIPQPIAADFHDGIAVYEYIANAERPVLPITLDDLRQAITFFRMLNAHRADGLERLGPVSEACFSISEHVATIDRRVRALLDIDPESEIDAEARTFVHERLWPTWERVRAGVEAYPDDLLTAEVPPEGRCISPSDFGFHNTLRRTDGALVFLDFEYAGVDDPARVAPDFFCQPAVPAPVDAFDLFLDEALAGFPEADLHRQRSRILRPVYQIKWCCIMLNHFLPAGRHRRQFARSDRELASQKFTQLEKARHALESIKE